MADEYYAEPDLATVLQRNALDPAEPAQPPSWWQRYGLLGTPAMQARGPWMREYLNPYVANFLGGSLLALGGLRSAAGAARVPPRGSTDPGITGVSPLDLGYEYIGRSTRPIESLGVRHPGAAANANKSLQIDGDPYIQAGIDKSWNDMVRRARLHQFDVIPGGKK